MIPGVPLAVPYDKNGRRRERAAVRALLNAQWDPIGVGDDAPDEYDSYAAAVYVMLRDGSSRDRIVAYLLAIERDGMGFEPDPERAKSVADALLRLELNAR